MNAYRLNGLAGNSLRLAIIAFFKLEPGSLYRAVKDIQGSVITMYNGKKYEVTLKELN